MRGAGKHLSMPRTAFPQNLKTQNSLSYRIIGKHITDPKHTVKNLPATQGTQVRSLGQEEPLEEDMATHSSIRAWGLSWTEEPGGLQSTGSHRVGHN